MRLPTEAQLSTEQREIIFAPSDGTLLVVGPPGSGKTVVALHRANALKSRGKVVSLGMYNKVLRTYTGAESETLLSWIAKWWNTCTNRQIPRENARPGTTFRPPDYFAALEFVKQNRENFVRRGNWGHLIIDEAQDFPPQMHQFFSYLMNAVFAPGPAEKKPSLMVLADENQRLTSTNSTIAQIRHAYFLDEQSVYPLKKNYRNTREIARFSAEFYVGLPSGIPDLPDSRGELPRIEETENLDRAVERIAAYARLHENEEIGVLTYYDRTRKKLYNKLAHRLKSFQVQTYGSSDNGDAAHLEFKGRTITVLCFASGKGLEFDSVFLPELQAFRAEAEQEDLARMNLYVMCSRARKQLSLSVSGDPAKSAPIWRLMPSKTELFRLVR